MSVNIVEKNPFMSLHLDQYITDCYSINIRQMYMVSLFEQKVSSFLIHGRDISLANTEEDISKHQREIRHAAV